MLTNTFCLSCVHFPVKPCFYFYLHKSIFLVLFTLCSQTLLSFYLCKSNFLVLFTLPSQTLFLCYPACKSNFLLLFTLCSQTFLLCYPACKSVSLSCSLFVVKLTLYLTLILIFHGLSNIISYLCVYPQVLKLYHPEALLYSLRRSRRVYNLNAHG